MNSSEVARAIQDATGLKLRAADRGDLRRLSDLGAPDEVVAFFRAYEPPRFAEIAEVRLLPIADIIVENTDAEPGASIHPHGLLTFATSVYGDAYCLDLTNSQSTPAPVVLMSHELGFFDMAKAEVLTYRKKVANSFSDFLDRFVQGKLDLEPLYEPGPEG